MARWVRFDYSFVPQQIPQVGDWIGRCWNYFNVYSNSATAIVPPLVFAPLVGIRPENNPTQIWWYGCVLCFLLLVISAWVVRHMDMAAFMSEVDNKWEPRR